MYAFIEAKFSFLPAPTEESHVPCTQGKAYVRCALFKHIFPVGIALIFQVYKMQFDVKIFPVNKPAISSARAVNTQF